MSEQAIVLVGMSVREVDARERLLGLAAPHGATVAFLQLGDPSVSRELTRLADGDAQEILLVGASFGTLAPAQSWLRRIAAHWLRERAGRAPSLRIAPEVLKDPDAAQLTQLIVGEGRLVTGAEAGLESGAWENVPSHRHQVLVCRGPRCTAKGSDKSAESLVLALMAQGLGDDDVLITHTGCQFPCNHAPLMSVQPDDVWYGRVDGEVAREIVTRHLIGGEPVEAHRLAREARPRIE